MSMSHCFILPLIVQLRQLRDRCCKMMLLSEGFGMASEEKSDSPLFHSFGFAVSPSEMDLKKETMSGVQIFQLLCRVAVLHIEIVVNSWCFSVHMSMQIFERWPQLQWVSEIPFTDLWCGFDSVQRLLLLSNWNAYPYLSITRKLFVAGNECGHRRKCCLHIFCARVLKCIALRQKPCESDCSLPLGWDLPKVWAYTNTLQKCFHLPAAHKVCAAFREAIASAALCCLQQEPSSAMPTSSTYTPSVKSSECSWTAKVPPVKFSTALEPRFIRPVTQNHCYRFSMRVRWGVEMTVLPLISKGMERWQGHRRSIKVFETALKLLCTDAEPWSHVQWLGSIAVIHFPISSSRTPDSSKVLCSSSLGSVSQGFGANWWA